MIYCFWTGKRRLILLPVVLIYATGRVNKQSANQDAFHCQGERQLALLGVDRTAKTIQRRTCSFELSKLIQNESKLQGSSMYNIREYFRCLLK